MNAFAERYAAMREEDLYREAGAVQNLVPAAREALRAEIERRHLSVKKINWKAKASSPRPRRQTNQVGDAAGEYREMERGKYHAWIHVGVAFVLQVAILSTSLVSGLDAVLPRKDLAFPIGLNLGFWLSFLIYWNRWRCIEAYASEYCTGIFGVSLLGVPFITLLYANYRGFRKLRGL